MRLTKSKYAGSAKEFYLKEYESLRKEIEWTLTDYRALERNVVIAVGATWVWLLKDSKPELPTWPWLIPCLFALLGTARAAGIMKSFRDFHSYINMVEDSFSGVGDAGGWEHFSWEKTWTGKSAIAFWSLLTLTTLFVAYLEVVKPGETGVHHFL